MTRIHQIRAYIRDLLRLVRSWVTFASRLESTWLILMLIFTKFPILGFLSEPTGNLNDPFFKCFQKEWSCGTRLLKPHLFGSSIRSSCVSGHFRCSSMGHPGTTCAPKVYGRKKSGQDMLFWFPVTFRCFDRGVCGACGKCHFISFCLNPGSRWLVAGRNSMNNIMWTFMDASRWYLYCRLVHGGIAHICMI